MSPPGICLLLISQLTDFLSLQTLSKMCDYKFFSKDPNQWDENYQLLWRGHSICPLLEQFQVTQVTQSELSSLIGSGVWGNAKRFHSDLAHLLVLPEKATKEEMMLRLAVVWVHPYQAHIPTLDEALRTLTLLTTSCENWAYVSVKFRGCPTCSPPQGRSP